MTEFDNAGGSAEASPVSPSRKGRRQIWLGQFGIAEMLLLMAAVATWAAYFVYQSRNQQLEASIAELQVAALELSVDDESQLHAIEQLSLRYEDQVWLVFIPEGGNHTIKMAVDGIDEGGFPATGVQSATLTPGQHRIELRHVRDAKMQIRYQVRVDEEPVFDSPDDFGSRNSSSSGVGKTQVKRSATKPLVLKRQRDFKQASNGRSVSDQGPVHGLLLWVDPGS